MKKALLYLIIASFAGIYLVLLAFIGPWFESINGFIDVSVAVFAYLFKAGLISAELTEWLAYTSVFVFMFLFDLVCFIPFLLMMFYIPIDRKIKLLIVSCTIGGVLFFVLNGVPHTIWPLLTLGYSILVIPSFILLNSLFGVRNRETSEQQAFALPADGRVS